MTTSNHMRIRIFAGVVVSALALSIATGPRSAENTPTDRSASTTSSTESSRGEMASRDLRASKVIGMKVRNAQDESLGKIDDLIIDVNNDRVSYAVLSFGGALGMGQKLFAYPLAVFRPAAGRSDELVLNVDKDKLKSAPGFDRKNWPDWNRDSYRGDVDRYFGPTVSVKTLPDQRLARASELIGRNVDDRGGRHAGELEDIVVNLGDSRIRYAVLDLDKAWSSDDKLIPLSMKALTFPEKQDRDLKLNLASTDLDMRYGFEEKRWPDVADPSWQQRIESYLQRSATMSRSTGQAGPVRE